MSQNKTDITDTTLCAVPAPLPPNSPEAWYAPQVRSQHEVTPGVIITIIDQADHVGFRYQIREPSLDTDSEDALAEIRAYFAGANLESGRPLTREGTTERATHGLRSKYRRVINRILDKSIIGGRRRRITYYVLRDFQLLGSVTPIALDEQIEIVDLDDEIDFPHPPDWNLVSLSHKEISLGDTSDKYFHDLSLSDLQSEFSTIQNIRRRGIIGSQLNLRTRAGEVCSAKFPELNISHEKLQKQYPELGTHPALREHSDVVYILHDRDGNKSSNPRLLPIDDELRWLLLRHLLTRPQVDEPWVFLLQRTFTKMDPQGVNKEWKVTFHPEYAETDDFAPITSHFGRHWFSSFWRLVEDMKREHVRYMRGDRVQPVDDFPDTIDDYLHPSTLSSNLRSLSAKYLQTQHRLGALIIVPPQLQQDPVRFPSGTQSLT